MHLHLLPIADRVCDKALLLNHSKVLSWQFFAQFDVVIMLVENNIVYLDDAQPQYLVALRGLRSRFL